ncbi:hypothetical protein ACEQ6A_35315, partial [Rhizobium brockwellii]|uniref:hypothetical protein n=1 Tax=Rhizobium brockwellii TaxID=3019932 RepID=UPI003F96BF67
LVRLARPLTRNVSSKPGIKCERWMKTWKKPTEGHFISCPARAEGGLFPRKHLESDLQPLENPSIQDKIVQL